MPLQPAGDGPVIPSFNDRDNEAGTLARPGWKNRTRHAALSVCRQREGIGALDGGSGRRAQRPDGIMDRVQGRAAPLARR
jgi:hypothetical protein